MTFAGFGRLPLDLSARGRRQPNAEGRSFSGCAVGRDRAAHHLDEPLADRKAQAGAAVSAGRRCVGLGEFRENLGELLGRHADAGIGHAHRIAGNLAWRDSGDSQCHRPALGELAGVAEEVEQHLAQAHLVAAHGRGAQVALEREPIGILVRQRLSGDDKVARHDDKVEVLLVKLDLAGLDLREVKHVVDKAEEMLPARCTRSSGSVKPANSGPSASSRSISVRPMMALSGVRSSWLILARNCDLCWLAT